MKLLLDEHYSPVVAEHLREQGLDVVAVLEARLRGSADAALLTWAAREQRTLLTNNAQDFLPLHAEWLRQGRSHGGIWLTDDGRLPRSRATIGRFVAVLSDAMRARPGADACVDMVRWLP